MSDKNGPVTFQDFYFNRTTIQTVSLTPARGYDRAVTCAGVSSGSRGTLTQFEPKDEGRRSGSP